MSESSPALLRTTQRAPRSCVSCSARKVKCDKAIPCSTCISRGVADSCVREAVIVRGEVKIAADLPDLPSYDALMRENQRLRDELQAERKLARSTPVRRPRRRQALESDEAFEDILFQRTALMMPSTARKRLNWSCLILPSPICSQQLVQYDRIWNSWVHYAIEYPQFDEEHQRFFSALQQGLPLEQTDVPWLAVYFSVLCAALLMMHDDEACKLSLPDQIGYSDLCRHWYDAAIFCLHEAEFMRRANIRSVQAVAILGMCFNNFGDPDLGTNMWSCAIRTAQKLGIDDNSDSRQLLPLSPQGQRRLWWTLVICEWMTLPYHPPQVEEGDFDMTLPSPDPLSPLPGSAHIQHVYYHIFMSRTSTVYYRFRASLRAGERPVADIVRRADDELAEVINTLPDYLQPDSGETEAIDKLETEYPCVKWQRFDITLILLHHRIRINRVLQREWLSSPGKYDWARSVCIKSATSLIWICHNWDQPATMRKQWALSMHLFVAAMLLFRESKSSKQTGPLKFRDEIETAISQLDGVASHSAIAFQAAALLRDLLEGVLPDMTN